jgi:hypothetical protein
VKYKLSKRTKYKTKTYGVSKPKQSTVPGRLPNDQRHTAKWQKFRERYLADPKNARCAYCGDWANTIDHVVPLSADPNIDCFDQTNLLPCCHFCQSSKKDLSYKDWRRKNMDGLEFVLNGIPACPKSTDHMITIGMLSFY